MPKRRQQRQQLEDDTKKDVVPKAQRQEVAAPSSPSADRRATNIEDLNHDVMLHIFKYYLDSFTIFTAANRVNKRWNEISKCASIWTTLDLTFVSLKPKDLRFATKRYFSSSTLVLRIRGLSEKSYSRQEGVPTKRQLVSPKTLTNARLEDLSSKWHRLQHLAIYFEQINFHGRSFLDYLPANNLKHLTLYYCNVAERELNAIFHQSMPLPQLAALDLSGAVVICLTGRYVHPGKLPEGSRMPPLLTHFFVRETELLHSVSNILYNHNKLTYLDVSKQNLYVLTLWNYSSSLVNLQTLDIFDSVLRESDEPEWKLTTQNWYNLWTVFRSVTTIMGRSTTNRPGPTYRGAQCVAMPMSNMFREVASVIDGGGEIKNVWIREEPPASETSFVSIPRKRIHSLNSMPVAIA